MEIPGFESRHGQDNFCLLQIVQAGSGTHPAFYSVVTGVKRTVRDAGHSLPYSAKITYEWSHTSASPIYLRGVVLLFFVTVLCRYLMLQWLRQRQVKGNGVGIYIRVTVE